MFDRLSHDGEQRIVSGYCARRIFANGSNPSPIVRHVTHREPHHASSAIRACTIPGRVARSLKIDDRPIAGEDGGLYGSRRIFLDPIRRAATDHMPLARKQNTPHLRDIRPKIRRVTARRVARGRLFKQFSTTVVDQVLLSGANFWVGFLLIRRTSDFDYGMFVLVQSAIALLISAQTAWLSSPLAVIGPTKSPDVRRSMIGAIEVSQTRWLKRIAALSLLAPVIGYFSGTWTGLQSAVIGVGILACWAALQREYLRSVLLIYARPHSMLRADVVYVVILLAGALIAAYGPKPAVIWAVAALVAAAVMGGGAARRSLGKDPGWVSGNAALFWRELRPLGVWATVGAAIYWLYSQSYNYVLASRVNLTAVADVNAVRLLLMPTIVLTVGVKTLLVPTAARWLADSSLGRLIRRLIVFATGIAVLDFFYFAMVWIFRDWLSMDMMHKTIGDRDRLLILWAILSLIALYRDLLQTGLFVLHKFKPLAWLTATSAIVSLSIMWFGIKIWGPAAALIGQVAGEGVNLAGVIVLLAGAYFQSRQRRTFALKDSNSA
jgi:O-antigen/teichoic acid export membrane protein